MHVTISPPCAAFSSLQRLWNNKRRRPEAVEDMLAEGRTFVKHSMAIARAQLDAGRCFTFEHPAAADSWSLPEVLEVGAYSTVSTIVFDQCQFGLRSPSGQFLRKRTKLMTNSPKVKRLFAGK
eukprot:3452196-Alexandrium_andersonii.AAC.1